MSAIHFSPVASLPDPDETDSVERCGICLTEFNEGDIKKMQVVAHKIGEKFFHFMHKECLKNWAKRNPTCPSCRETIDRRSLFTSIEKASIQAKKISRVVAGVGVVVVFGAIFGTATLMLAGEEAGLREIAVGAIKVGAIVGGLAAAISVGEEGLRVVRGESELKVAETIFRVAVGSTMFGAIIGASGAAGAAGILLLRNWYPLPH